jgi:hypothetical protein
MSGEGDFGSRREDPNMGGVAGARRRQHEGGFGIVEFRRDRLHLNRA